MSADKDLIVLRQDQDNSAIGEASEERRKARLGGDRSLQAGLIEWLGSRAS